MTRTSTLLRYSYVGLAFAGIALALGSGLQVARASDQRSAPSSVQETMNRLIDPAADAIWASVGTIETKDGSHLRAPQTDAQWLKVTGYAQSLVAGAKRLQEPGLPVGTNAHSRLADADTPGTRNAAQIRAHIDADPARFRAAATRLEKASDKALTAARTRDVSGLLSAGEALDAACEACHAAYWYPRTPPLRLPSAEEFAAKPGRP